MAEINFLFFLVVMLKAVHAQGPGLGIQICSAPGKCQQQGTGLVIDYSWTGCKDQKSCYTVKTFNLNQSVKIKVICHEFFLV